jgi:Smg protein
MKENVFDVLMFLFDNYLEDEFEINADQDILKKKLVQAGFGNSEVNKAFDWLEGLIVRNDVAREEQLSGKGVKRIFNEQEMGRLDTECRGFITYLNQAGILDMHDRELVIDRVMALESEEIDLYQLKWVVLMVLLNQPGKEDAFSWMEGIVMDQVQAGLH